MRCAVLVVALLCGCGDDDGGVCGGSGEVCCASDPQCASGFSCAPMMRRCIVIATPDARPADAAP